MIFNPKTNEKYDPEGKTFAWWCYDIIVAFTLPWVCWAWGQGLSGGGAPATSPHLSQKRELLSLS